MHKYIPNPCPIMNILHATKPTMSENKDKKFKSNMKTENRKKGATIEVDLVKDVGDVIGRRANAHRRENGCDFVHRDEAITVLVEHGKNCLQFCNGRKNTRCPKILR